MTSSINLLKLTIATVCVCDLDCGCVCTVNAKLLFRFCFIHEKYYTSILKGVKYKQNNNECISHDLLSFTKKGLQIFVLKKKFNSSHFSILCASTSMTFKCVFAIQNLLNVKIAAKAGFVFFNFSHSKFNYLICFCFFFFFFSIRM